MNHLFLVRHGLYSGPEQRLSEEGTRQVQEMGSIIARILAGNLAYIASSDSFRTWDTAHELAKSVNLCKEMEVTNYLFDFNKEVYPACMNNSLTFINQRRDYAPGLILVTHMDIADCMANWFVKKEFGLEYQSRVHTRPNYGEAIHIDLEKRTWEMLSHGLDRA